MTPTLYTGMRRRRGPIAAAVLVVLSILAATQAIRAPSRPAGRSGRGAGGETGVATRAATQPGGAGSPGAAPRGRPTEARLLVTVTGLDGLAAADVAVTLAGSGVWPPRTSPTGEDGAVEFDEVPAGVYEVRARTDDAIAQPFEGLELARGEERRLFLALESGRAIVGSVRDAATGAPIAGAHVLVAEEALSAAPRVAQTGPDGGFVVEPVLERPHLVSVRAPGYVPRLGLEVTGGDPALDVTLNRGATLRGVVVDERGFPVEAAQVEVLGLDLEGGPVDVSAFGSAVEETGFAALLSGAVTLRPAGELGVTVGPLPPIPGAEIETPTEDVRPTMPGQIPEGLSTNARGEFAIEGVPPGRVAVHAWHPAHARGASRTLSVPPGGTIDDIEVVLRDGVRVAGRIVDLAGFPLRGAVVELRTEDDGLRIAVADAGGEFAFTGVLGTLSLRASARDHEPEAVTLAAEHATEIELALREAVPEMPGRVIDDRGFPVGHATVRVVPLTISAEPVVAVTADDGTFGVRVPAGVALSVEVRHPDHATLLEPGLVPDPAEGLRLALFAGGGVGGTVRAARGGFPVAPFELTLAGDGGLLVRRRVEDLDGRFEETGLPPGTVRLRVEAEGFAAWTGEVDVPPPRVAERVTADPVEVELEEAAVVRGEVVDARGDPVPGARVRAERPVRLVLGRGERPVTTDAAGRFELGGLSPRSTALWAAHPRLGTAQVDVDLERGSLDDVRIAFEGELDEAEEPRGPARFGGVAVVLEGVRIAEVLPDSEAERAGLREGDVVTSVDGAHLAPAALVRALRGPVGTELVVGITRSGTPRALRLAREMLYR